MQKNKNLNLKSVNHFHLAKNKKIHLHIIKSILIN